MEKKRIIFDLNGTLFESLDYTSRIRRILLEGGIEFKEDNLIGFIKGINTYEDYYDHYTYEDYARHLSLCSGLDLDIDFVKYFLSRADVLAPDRVEESVIDTLEYLKERYDLAVLTNYFAYAQYDQMAYVNISDYFTKVYGAEEIIKPYREAFINACGPYKPEECVMIGDNKEKDIEGAKNVPMDYVHINKKGTFNGSTEINEIKQLKLIL